MPDCRLEVVTDSEMPHVLTGNIVSPSTVDRCVATTLSYIRDKEKDRDEGGGRSQHLAGPAGQAACEPLAGAQVFLCDSIDEWVLLSDDFRLRYDLDMARTSTFTDEDGRFELCDLPVESTLVLSSSSALLSRAKSLSIPVAVLGDAFIKALATESHR